jgi:hypothetical protein
VRPGAIAYQFSTGDSVDQLIDRLQLADWRGQIVGQHGVGKSTLLAALIEPLQRRGRKPLQFSLHDGQRSLGIDLASYGSHADGTVVIVDGYEQLSAWSRWRLQRYCARKRWGLLVTAHVSAGLPTICHVQPDLAVVKRLARQLQEPGTTVVFDDDVASEFARHGGNVRETLFGLYDLYGLRQLEALRKVQGKL